LFSGFGVAIALGSTQAQTAGSQPSIVSRSGDRYPATTDGMIFRLARRVCTLSRSETTSSRARFAPGTLCRRTLPGSSFRTTRPGRSMCKPIQDAAFVGFLLRCLRSALSEVRSVRGSRGSCRQHYFRRRCTVVRPNSRWVASRSTRPCLPTSTILVSADKAAPSTAESGLHALEYYIGTQESIDPIYKSIPFFLGIGAGHSYGLFLDNTWRTWFDFGKQARDAYSFGGRGRPTRLLPDLRPGRNRLSKAMPTHRSPPPPPAVGFWASSSVAIAIPRNPRCGRSVRPPACGQDPVRRPLP